MALRSRLDDLGFRMTFAVDKVLYEQQTSHQHLVLFNHIALGHDETFLEYIPHLRQHGGGTDYITGVLEDVQTGPLRLGKTLTTPATIIDGQVFVRSAGVGGSGAREERAGAGSRYLPVRRCR